MIWLQAIVCFGIWIGYGFVQSRRSDQIREKLQALPRQGRAQRGAIMMVCGAAILFAAGIVAQLTGGFTLNGMTWYGWLLIAFGGLAFVHAQTMAMALLVSIVQEGVTSTISASSDQESPDAEKK